MSLLTIIQDVCNELTLPVPNTVIGNSDQQTAQLLALSNREGQEFVKIRGPWSGWPELNKVYTFNMVPVGPFTCTMTPNSTVLTNCSDTTGVLVGYGVAGNNIYPATTVTNVNAGAQTITISIAPSVTSVGNNVSVNFGKIAYDLPSDMSSFAPATAWDTNFRWQLLGPLSQQEQEVIERGISPVGPRIRYWLQDKKFMIQPLPGATQTDLISMRYISNSWCTAQDGTPNTPANGICKWASDSDLYVWPEDTQVLGIKWRFLRAKGLDYGEEYDSYCRARDLQMATSGISRNLPLNSSQHGIRLLSNMNLPDTGFGQ